MSNVTRNTVQCPICTGAVSDVARAVAGPTRLVECDSCHRSFDIVFHASSIETQKLVDFHRMCVDHDLTFTFADDSRSYNRGAASYKRIVEASKGLPLDAARAIWNAQVDAKIVEDSRHLFYWE
jgi:hypothetical protein